MIDFVVLDDNVLNLEVEWKSFSNGHGSVLLKWNDTTWSVSNEYKIFYVRIPYKNYWKEVYTSTVSNGSQSCIVKNLDVDVKYRFTLIPIKRVLHAEDEKVLQHKESINYNSSSLGITSSIYLMPLLSKNNTEVKSVKIPPPQDLKCHKIEEENQLMLSWKPIDNVRQYRIQIFGELDDLELTYFTHETHILIQNLTKGFWYGVKVQGYSLSRDANFQSTPYKSCRTKERGNYHLIF